VAVRPGDSRYLYVVRAVLTADAPLAEWHRWYDDKHVPELLTVPGFRSAARYGALSESRTFLATYEVDSPAVFEESRYGEVTGWGDYAQYVESWQRAVYEDSRSFVAAVEPNATGSEA
jgi:hypothetical protein